MKMSAEKNCTSFNLHVFFFICKFSTIYNFCLLLSYLLYIQRFIISEDACWNKRNGNFKSFFFPGMRLYFNLVHVHWNNGGHLRMKRRSRELSSQMAAKILKHERAEKFQF